MPQKTNNNTDRLIDEGRFEDFFRQNFQTACLVALRYVDDIAHAEDIVQEIFLSIWEKRKQNLMVLNLKHYLFSSVKNRAINFVQREKYTTITLDEEIDLPNMDDNAFRKEELAVKISKTIPQLPPRCQEIFKLAYCENLTYQQIADELEISKNTVKTQMGIAYKTLRENLKGLVISLFCMVKSFIKKK